MKRKYEIIFILDSSQIEESKIKKEIQDIILQSHGSIIKEQDLGLKNLAYPIKKKNKGFYYLIHAELEPLKVKELNQEILLNENILKSMTILLNKKIMKRMEQKKQREQQEQQKREQQQKEQENPQNPQSDPHQSDPHQTPQNNEQFDLDKTKQDQKNSNEPQNQPEISQKITQES